MAISRRWLLALPIGATVGKLSQAYQRRQDREDAEATMTSRSKVDQRFAEDMQKTSEAKFERTAAARSRRTPTPDR